MVAERWPEEPCPVCCDDECSGPDNHKLIRQMQVSDYSLGGDHGFYVNAVEEITAITGKDPTRDVRGRFLTDNWHEGEWGHEVLLEFQGTLPEGYAVWEDSDYWSIWRV